MFYSSSLSDWGKRTKWAFSIIELLAAIAVIAILASILIAVSSHVRMSAHKSQGNQAMRQIMANVFLYANDNGGTLPGPLNVGQRVVTQRGLSSQLVKLLGPYYGVDNDVPDGVVVDEMAPSAFLAQYDPTQQAPYYAVPKIFLPSGSYMRPWGSATSKSFYVPRELVPKSLLSLPDAVNAPAITDYDSELVLESGKGVGVDLRQRITEPLYGDSRLIVYWDGHVELVPADTKIYPTLFED